MEKFIQEAKENQNEVCTYENLNSRVDSIFKNLPQNKRDMILPVSYDHSLEKQSIFQTKIIGKQDIDLAQLISALDISDWVQQGHKHMEHTEGLCPFCQQELPINFKNKLNEYFDESYIKHIQALNSAINHYETAIKNLLEVSLDTENISFINKGRQEKLNSLIEVIRSTIEKNRQTIENKRKEPSRSIELSSITSNLEQINSEIEQENLQISKSNSLIDNIENEKGKLIMDIWKFIVEENKTYYEEYINSSKQKNKALEGMEKGKVKLEGYKQVIEEEKMNLQNQLTSVLPSIHEINNLLKSFGFTNFYLDESNEEGKYRIIRENGEDVNETLSEGEKTFISFLYFYQLVNGSNEQNTVNTARIIVIDDPISSLDSNILFIVSNLIKNIKKRIKKDNSNFKQLIILTHNVYFHKEVSFDKHRSRTGENFWIIRKIDNVSHIKQYCENPIKNSYELLWKELKENRDSTTTPNIMRRILENYFKLFGNINYDEIIEEFPSEDKIVCHSLLSWVNDGSHHINDDLYVDSNSELNKNYFDVFKKIFHLSKHDAHFDMMMGEEDSET